MSVRERKKEVALFFARLSPHQWMFSVNSCFEVEGLKAKTGISSKQPEPCFPSTLIPHLRSIPMPEHASND